MILWACWIFNHCGKHLSKVHVVTSHFFYQFHQVSMTQKFADLTCHMPCHTINTAKAPPTPSMVCHKRLLACPCPHTRPGPSTGNPLPSYGMRLGVLMMHSCNNCTNQIQTLMIINYNDIKWVAKLCNTIQYSCSQRSWLLTSHRLITVNSSFLKYQSTS